MQLILRDYQSQSLKETKTAFKHGIKRLIITLPCGAGKTAIFAKMAESSQAKGKTIWFLVHRKELLDQTIDTFNKFNIERKTIHIGMVGSYANRLGKYPDPDFIIYDECHFSAAATWQKITDAYPEAYIIGLTATPCRLDGKPLGKIYDKLIVGITARELINRGYLADYKYYAPSVADLSGLKRKGSDYDTAQASEILSQRAVFGDVIKHYREYADGLQTICYCTTVKHSEDMAQEFQAAGINAVHFDGNTPKKERTEIIRKFRNGEIQILCNCSLVSEGFDVPDCHCCILLRPTQSLGLYIQQSMRALRPQPGKTAIILDHVNNYARHGLPDDDRRWSLSDKIKPHKEYGEDGRLIVRQCPECYYTYKTAPVCPNCGYKTVSTPQEIKNMREIRLAEIKQTYREKAAEAVMDKSPDDCNSLMELQALAKQKGFKSGWAWHQAKRRKLI